MPGRLEVVGERPLTLLDGAHNPSGADALAASLPEVFGTRRPRVAVIGVLEDKDAAGMLEALLPHVDRVVFTRPANPRSLSPATLATLAEKLGGPPAETVAAPAGGARPGARAGGPRRRRARDRLDLPDRRPGARGRRTRGRRRCSALASSRGPVRPRRRARRVAGGHGARVARLGAGERHRSRTELRSAMHGVRSVEVVRALRPDSTSPRSRRRSRRRQAEDAEGLRAIPGAAEALSGIEGGPGRGRDLGHPAPGGRAAAAPWGSSRRRVMVYAEDVARGKPDPEGYLAAARRLGRGPGGGARGRGRAAGHRGGPGGGRGDGGGDDARTRRRSSARRTS